MNFNFENNDARRSDDEFEVYMENIALREKTEEYADADKDYYKRHHSVSLVQENQHMREDLDWESSPILPISEQLGPGWRPLDLSTATDAEVASALLDLLERLRRAHHEIWGADHLSNRRLYELIARRLLPHETKRLASPYSPAVWNFAFYTENSCLDSSDYSIWLTYYATPEERFLWARERDVALPQRQTPPFAGRFSTFRFLESLRCDDCD
ncbi:MAG: hypothetical protein IKU86_03440 [Thermoguttaceae bacterium]|nr:hypothetical protein [Thermoguttaceae bacterium]